MLIKFQKQKKYGVHFMNLSSGQILFQHITFFYLCFRNQNKSRNVFDWEV